MSSTISAVKEESNNCRDIEFFQIIRIIQIISQVVASATLLIACKAGP